MNSPNPSLNMKEIRKLRRLIVQSVLQKLRVDLKAFLIFKSTASSSFVIIIWLILWNTLFSLLFANNKQYCLTKFDAFNRIKKAEQVILISNHKQKLDKPAKYLQNIKIWHIMGTPWLCTGYSYLSYILQLIYKM